MAFYVKIEIIQILLLDLLRLIPLKNKISTPLGRLARKVIFLEKSSHDFDFFLYKKKSKFLLDLA